MGQRPKRQTSKAIREKRRKAALQGWQTRIAKHEKRVLAAKKGWRRRRIRESLARNPKRVTKREREIVARKPSQKTKVQKRVDKLERKLPPKEKLRQKKNQKELRDEVRKLRAEVQELKEEKRKKAYIDKHVKAYVDRFKHLTMLDGLPPQRVTESRDAWAYRIVRTMVKEGVYTKEQAYGPVAKHTGMNRSEIYSMFHYIGMGEMVA
jgi:hypothetical protein